jgi:hypothetical protein
MHVCMHTVVHMQIDHSRRSEREIVTDCRTPRRKKKETLSAVLNTLGRLRDNIYERVIRPYTR